MIRQTGSLLVIPSVSWSGRVQQVTPQLVSDGLYAAWITSNGSNVGKDFIPPHACSLFRQSSFLPESYGKLPASKGWNLSFSEVTSMYFTTWVWHQDRILATLANLMERMSLSVVNVSEHWGFVSKTWASLGRRWSSKFASTKFYHTHPGLRTRDESRLRFPPLLPPPHHLVDFHS